MLIAEERSILPLFSVDTPAFDDLLDEERQDWLTTLHWDTTEARELIMYHIRCGNLPGFAAVCQGKVIGYTYYTLHGAVGHIGTLYVSRDYRRSGTMEALLCATVDAMKYGNAQRLEAQIFPFGIDMTPAFLRLGFALHRRYYLGKELTGTAARPVGPSDARGPYRVEPWSDGYIEEAGKVIHAGYAGSPDAAICQVYRSVEGCTAFMRSLTLNPGCGTMTPAASFVALDRHGRLCGLIIGATIGNASALIPQISVLPEHQGAGLGKLLMDRTLQAFCQLGYHRISLSVTEKNTRAFAWYRKLGFTPRSELLAFTSDCRF
jgi:ribosomal protein S18 acetylase RimI-like enzyme